LTIKSSFSQDTPAVYPEEGDIIAPSNDRSNSSLFEKLGDWLSFSTISFSLLEIFIAIGFISSFLFIVARWRYHVNWKREFEEAQIESMRELARWKARSQSESSREIQSNIEPIVPLHLAEQLAAGQAVLGIGSELSQIAGRPSWSEILPSIGNEFSESLPASLKRVIVELSENPEALDVSTLSDLFDAIISEIGRDQLTEVLRKTFLRGPQSSDLHDQLATLGWSGVLSMKLDSVGDRAFLRRGVRDKANAASSYTRILPDEEKILRGSLSSNKRFFAQTLGDLQYPDSAVLTLQEMRQNLQFAPEYTRQIGLLLDTRTFFFVGIPVDGLKEYLQAFSARSQESENRHYALVPFRKHNERFRTILGHYGVELLEYQSIEPLYLIGSYLNSLENRTLNSRHGDLNDTDSLRTNMDFKFSDQRLEYLKLKNIGPFRSLELDFEPATDGSNWIVIMGENGIGKTCILRSIAIALIANEDAVLLATGKLLREGARNASIVLRIGRQRLAVDLIRDRIVRPKAQRASPVEAGQMLVLGFPALRGAPSVDPSGPNRNRATPPQPSDLVPLVTGDVDPRMSDFKQWIINVLSHSRIDEKNRRIRRLLDAIVAELVPGDFAGFADLDDSNELYIKTKNKSMRDVSFNTVSQGMASIFNWIGLLTKRMYDVFDHPDIKLPHEQHAVVLIDEMDAHLHPDWQRRLVTITKRFFPNVQVIATTHSPLIASSLQASEIRILERDETGVASLRKPTVRTFGQSADFILQSEVMGLENARPLSVERKIQHYIALSSTRNLTASQKQEMVELRRELSNLGWSGVLEQNDDNRPDPSPKEMVEFLEKNRR